MRGNGRFCRRDRCFDISEHHRSSGSLCYSNEPLCRTIGTTLCKWMEPFHMCLCVLSGIFFIPRIDRIDTRMHMHMQWRAHYYYINVPFATKCATQKLSSASRLRGDSTQQQQQPCVRALWIHTLTMAQQWTMDESDCNRQNSRQYWTVAHRLHNNTTKGCYPFYSCFHAVFVPSKLSQLFRYTAMRTINFRAFVLRQELKVHAIK